jgi:hypothetical protein
MDIDMLNAIEEVLSMEDDEVNWNLELTKDRQHIEWRGNEKSRDFEMSLNFVIEKMRESCPTFDLE